MGTVIASAMPVIHSVPMNACLIPPTVTGSSGPAFDMSWVKKLMWSRASWPFHNVLRITNASAPKVTNVAE